MQILCKTGDHPHKSRSAGKEFLYTDIGFFVISEFQKIERPETELVGNDDIGKLLDADIIQVDAFIVVLTPVGDGVFQRCYAVLQVLKCGIGL